MSPKEAGVSLSLGLLATQWITGNLLAASSMDSDTQPRVHSAEARERKMTFFLYPHWWKILSRPQVAKIRLRVIFPGNDASPASEEVTTGVPLTGSRLSCASLCSSCREMAQRLLLRRFLTSVIPRKPPQGGWTSLTSRTLQTPQYNPGGLTGTPSPARTLHTTRVCSTTFNVQDGPDFQDRVVNSETPVVVDFHAQWCGPCKILGPRLEKMVAKQHGKVVMAKVDIDDHTDLAIEYEVSAVPTVLAIKNGDVVDKFVGIKDEDQLEAFLKKLIG